MSMFFQMHIEHLTLFHLDLFTLRSIVGLLFILDVVTEKKDSSKKNEK